LGASGTRRLFVAIAVVAVHLAFLAALIEATHHRKLSPATENVVTTTLYFPAATPRLPATSQDRTARSKAATSSAITEPMQSMAPPASYEPSRPEEPIDWLASAHQAARDVLAAEAAELKLDGRMGSGWWLAQDARQHRVTRAKSFPWSRQPLRSWVDIDPSSFVFTFTLNRRCAISVFIVVAELACNLGPLDPEPGRSDLFDPKYKAGTLELPLPAINQLPEP